MPLTEMTEILAVYFRRKKTPYNQYTDISLLANYFRTLFRPNCLNTVAAKKKKKKYIQVGPTGGTS